MTTRALLTTMISTAMRSKRPVYMNERNLLAFSSGYHGSEPKTDGKCDNNFTVQCHGENSDDSIETYIFEIDDSQTKVFVDKGYSIVTVVGKNVVGKNVKWFEFKTW